MRISDLSSVVCSSDLQDFELFRYNLTTQITEQITDDTIDQSPTNFENGILVGVETPGAIFYRKTDGKIVRPADGIVTRDRKSVVWGKTVSVRVDLGGRRIIKKKKK